MDDPLSQVDGIALQFRAFFGVLIRLNNTSIYLKTAVGGKICTVIDLAVRLPEQVWYKAEAQAHDSGFLADVLSLVRTGTLWVFDRGFYAFGFFGELIARGGHFITRLKAKAAYQVLAVLPHTDGVRERIISLGSTSACPYPLRLIEVRFGSTWYRYVTSVLDPTLLPASVVVELYRQRWHIEEAFLVVKRLLSLAYLWTGSLNGILRQVWATWLFFAVLVDLGDAVAEALLLPFDRISLEMVFRGLYHSHNAFGKGQATDPVAYLAAPQNRDLGAVKRLRPARPPLNVAPSET